MVVNQFRSWALTAAPTCRAEAAAALASALLYRDLDSSQRANAIAVLTALLDDPSVLVRRAMAEILADAPDAPHHIVLALADDQAHVAAIVLGRSPVLSDAELVDCAAVAEPAAQSAIASRPRLSSSVVAALAEIAEPEALVALARNTSVKLPAFSVQRMVERHGSDAALREALLVRSDLPSCVRLELVAATAKALASFVSGRNWMSDERLARVTRDAKDRAAMVIAGNEQRPSGSVALVAHLRKAGQLTVGFMLRALLSGRTELFRAALADLSGVPLSRVDGLVAQSASMGFAALYRKASLPPELLPAFRIALQAVRESDWTTASGALSLSVVERVLTSCAAINHGELDRLMVLLRRFESEAARDGVRDVPSLPKTSPALALRAQATPLLLVEAKPREEPSLLPQKHRTERRVPLMLMAHVAAIEAELRAA